MKFDYNSERPHLKQPEYGRVVQKMVDYCLQKVNNKSDRTKVAKSIIEIMASMKSQLRGADDFKQKLYDHLAIMSDFQLDINWEFELPNKENIEKQPNLLQYSENNIKIRHYGKFTEDILKKIKLVENEEERNNLIESVANNMKRLYYTWTAEQVSDEIIFKDMLELSDYSFKIPENLILADYNDLIYNDFNPMKQGQDKRKRNTLKKKKKRRRNGNI